MTFTPPPNMKSKISKHITIYELRELFEVRGSDGVWKTSRAPKIKVGSVAGTIHKGYRSIGAVCRDGKTHLMLAHHVAFALHHGRWAAGLIDHRDGNGLNNHPDNLREATNSQNSMNKSARADNKTGVKGVFYMPGRAKPYHARVKSQCKVVFAEYFTALEEATIAVQEARIKHHGDFARHA